MDNPEAQGKVLEAIAGSNDADLAPYREIAERLTAELNGRGEILGLQVREIATGQDVTFSHPMHVRILRELRVAKLIPEQEPNYAPSLQSSQSRKGTTRGPRKQGH